MHEEDISSWVQAQIDLTATGDFESCDDPALIQLPIMSETEVWRARLLYTVQVLYETPAKLDLCSEEE